MSQLRWNPFLNEWVIINPRRMKRPNLPEKHSCPFCPGSPEIAGQGEWSVISLPNRFPALGIPDEKANRNDPILKSRPGVGSCEVIVYSPDHDLPFYKMSLDQIIKIIDLWTERFKDLGSRKEISYVLIFENKGRFIGVSLDHPHGQIYAFPFIPIKIERELKNAKNHHEQHGTCLYCDHLKEELEEGSRIVIENEDFICFIPFFATWPYGTHIYPKKHVQTLLDFTDEMKKSLASMLKQIINKYEILFGSELAYELILHQAPSDGIERPYYHFHVEIYVMNRGEGKMKYLGGCELGSGVFVNSTSPEEVAKILRNT
ncbi:MAG: galactose-1-phosphate uridylyltransferase [Candidatus Helarchaeales archaeon]